MIKRIDNYFKVDSFSDSSVSYNVKASSNALGWECDCPKFIHQKTLAVCKHIVAIKMFLRDKNEKI